MNLVIHLLIYFILLSVILYGSLAYNPRMWLHRMPPEVVEKVPAKTPEEKRLLLKTVGIPFLLLLIAYPTVYVLQQDANWLTYFLILCAFLAGFDVWDTLILDLLIFCKFTPRLYHHRRDRAERLCEHEISPGQWSKRLGYLDCIFSHLGNDLSYH